MRKDDKKTGSYFNFILVDTSKEQCLNKLINEKEKVINNEK